MYNENEHSNYVRYKVNGFQTFRSNELPDQREVTIYKACIPIYSILISGSDGFDVWAGLSPRLFITHLLSFWCLVFSLDIYVMYTCFTPQHVFYLHLIGSMQVICHFNICLTQAGVMHEAVYAYSSC